MSDFVLVGDDPLVKSNVNSETGKTHLCVDRILSKIEEMNKELDCLATDDAEVKRSDTEQRRKGPDHSRLEKLYNDGFKSKQYAEKRQAELLSSQCPFSPKITKRAKQLRRKSPNRYKALYENASKKREMQAAKMKEQKEQYSFQPKITSKAKSLSTPTNTSKRFERLYQHGKRSLAMREQKRKEFSSPECTFRPNTSASASSHSSTTMFKARRLCPTKEEQAKKREVAEKKSQVLLLQDCTFSPKLKSSRARDRKHSIEFRRLDELERRKRNVEELRDAIVKQEMSQCTFGERKKLSAKEIDETCARLASTGLRTRYKVSMLRDAEFHRQMSMNLEAPPRADARWNSLRFLELYEQGKEKVSTNLEIEKDKSRSHSLVEKKEREEILECTFTPRTNSSASSCFDFHMHSGTIVPKDSTCKRLYEQAQELRNKREQEREAHWNKIKEEQNSSFVHEVPKYRKSSRDMTRLEHRRKRLYHYHGPLKWGESRLREKETGSRATATSVPNSPTNSPATRADLEELVEKLIASSSPKSRKMTSKVSSEIHSAPMRKTKKVSPNAPKSTSAKNKNKASTSENKHEKRRRRKKTQEILHQQEEEKIDDTQESVGKQEPKKVPHKQPHGVVGDEPISPRFVNKTFQYDETQSMDVDINAWLDDFNF